MKLITIILFVVLTFLGCEKDVCIECVKFTRAKGTVSIYEDIVICGKYTAREAEIIIESTIVVTNGSVITEITCKE